MVNYYIYSSTYYTMDALAGGLTLLPSSKLEGLLQLAGGSTKFEGLLQ